MCGFMGEIGHWQDPAREHFAVSTHTPMNNHQVLSSVFISANLTVPHSPHREQPGGRNIPRGQDLPPAPIDGMYDKWFFISGAAV